MQDSRFKIQVKKLKNSKTCNLQPACPARFAARRAGRLITCNSRRAGFTLIELAVVIAIISIAITVIMPSFWHTGKNSVKTEARHISGALRYIYDEAVGKKQTYLLNINLDTEAWSFTGKNETRNFRIKGNVEIRDVIIPSHGEISKGEVTVVFGPMGPEEPLIMHLRKDKYEYSVIFNHLNGRTKVLEGYKT